MQLEETGERVKFQFRTNRHLVEIREKSNGQTPNPSQKKSFPSNPHVVTKIALLWPLYYKF